MINENKMNGCVENNQKQEQKQEQYQGDVNNDGGYYSPCIPNQVTNLISMILVNGTQIYSNGMILLLSGIRIFLNNTILLPNGYSVEQVEEMFELSSRIICYDGTILLTNRTMIWPNGKITSFDGTIIIMPNGHIIMTDGLSITPDEKIYLISPGFYDYDYEKMTENPAEKFEPVKASAETIIHKRKSNISLVVNHSILEKTIKSLQIIDEQLINRKDNLSEIEKNSLGFFYMILHGFKWDKSEIPKILTLNGYKFEYYFDKKKNIKYSGAVDHTSEKRNSDYIYKNIVTPYLGKCIETLESMKSDCLDIDLVKELIEKLINCEHEKYELTILKNLISKSTFVDEKKITLVDYKDLVCKLFNDKFKTIHPFYMIILVSMAKLSDIQEKGLLSDPLLKELLHVNV